MRDSVRSDSRDAHWYCRRCWKYVDQGDYEQALEHIEKATALEPKVPLYWTIKAEFLIDLGRYAKAEKSLERALQLAPKSAVAWFVKGRLELKLRRFRGSADAFSKSAEIKPTHETYTMLAGVQLEFDARAAVQNAQKALDLDPDWDEAKTVLEEARKRILSE